MPLSGNEPVSAANLKAAMEILGGGGCLGDCVELEPETPKDMFGGKLTVTMNEVSSGGANPTGGFIKGVDYGGFVTIDFAVFQYASSTNCPNMSFDLKLNGITLVNDTNYGFVAIPRKTGLESITSVMGRAAYLVGQNGEYQWLLRSGQLAKDTLNASATEWHVLTSLALFYQ